jgi:predicted secreted protein
MSLYTGVTGKLSIKKGAATAVDVVHMSNWEVELKKEMMEVVSFGNDYKEKSPSIKDWSASSEGMADFDTDGGQKLLVDSFEDGSVLEATFYLTTTTFLKGDAYIESLSISDAADGAAEISISLAGSGAVVLTLPA